MKEDCTVELNPAFAASRTAPTRDAAPEDLAEACHALAALDAVAEARIVNGKDLQLRYDASRLGFWEIEDLLDKAGVARPDSFWWHVKSEWFRFTDNNARENAHHVAACCSKAPVKPGGEQ
jgi:hypothetical protein